MIAAIALLLWLVAPARATPSEELEQARELFRSGDFARAIPPLNYLLYPSPRLSQPEDLVEAHLLLAVCAIETGDPKTARREFEEALFLDPKLTLDAQLFSSKAVEFFEDVRRDFEEREARDAEQRRIAEENERLRRALESMYVYEKRPYYVNFIPFGAGQFQNGQREKGLFFATSQAVTGGLSAGIWLYLVGEYGLPGSIPQEEQDTVRQVRRLQQIEIGAGALCLGLMAWGVIDSLVHYEPVVRGEADPSLLKLRDKKPETRIEPTLLPGGAGVSLTWEY